MFIPSIFPQKTIKGTVPLVDLARSRSFRLFFCFSWTDKCISWLGISEIFRKFALPENRKDCFVKMFFKEFVRYHLASIVYNTQNYVRISRTISKRKGVDTPRLSCAWKDQARQWKDTVFLYPHLPLFAYGRNRNFTNREYFAFRLAGLDLHPIRHFPVFHGGCPLPTDEQLPKTKLRQQPVGPVNSWFPPS